ncbi:MAG: hypothetical protein ACREBR_04780 [bacterium]
MNVQWANGMRVSVNSKLGVLQYGSYVSLVAELTESSTHVTSWQITFDDGSNLSYYSSELDALHALGQLTIV